MLVVTKFIVASSGYKSTNGLWQYLHEMYSQSVPIVDK
jgi:hypothetical protein